MQHRLFLALRPPRAIRERLLDLMEGVPGARWQDDGQLHLTLRFLGELSTASAEEFAQALQGIEFEPLEIFVSGVGCFEKKGRAHTLWAGVEESERLLRLQRKVERFCISRGLEPERRRFKPHVTIARLNASTGPIEPFLLANSGFEGGRWTARSMGLYESTLGPGGSVYEERMEVVFA